MNNTDGSLAHIAGTARPKEYHYTQMLESGKRSPKFRCRTRNEGQALYAKWVEQQAIEAVRGSAEQRTVRYYIEQHWEAVKRGLADTSRDLNESTRKVHVLSDDLFMDLDYYELTAADVQKFLGRINGSEHTKRRVYNYLRWAFQAAVDERLLTLNPIHVAKSKIPKKNESRVISFKPDEQVKLLKFVASDPFWNAVCLLAFDSGIRMSELLGVQYDKVNFRTAEVSIHRTLIYANGQPMLRDSTKTDSSYRTIKVSQTTLDALKALRGQGNALSSYLFTKDGKPWSRHNFDNAWVKLLVAAEVPHYGFHSTRHSCATTLLRAGHFITAVSKRLGHAKPSMTLDLYSDAIPFDDATLADAFDGFMAQITAIAKAA